jgi:hypothetical protein
MVMVVVVEAACMEKGKSNDAWLNGQDKARQKTAGWTFFPSQPISLTPSPYCVPVCASTKSGLVTWNSLQHTHTQREATKSGQVKGGGERGWGGRGARMT